MPIQTGATAVKLSNEEMHESKTEYTTAVISDYKVWKNDKQGKVSGRKHVKVARRALREPLLCLYTYI